MDIDIKVNINKKLIDYAVKDYEYMMHHKKHRDTSVEEAFSNNSTKYKKLLRSLLGIIIFIGKTGLPEIKFRYDKNSFSIIYIKLHACYSMDFTKYYFSTQSYYGYC